MSSKYNRFLLSTCLPVMALGLCLSAPSAHAGFEWTPPEKTEPVQVMPAPEMEIPEPVAVDPVMSETLEDTAMDVEVEIEEPPIAITVIEEEEIEEAMPEVEMVEPEPVDVEMATETALEDVDIVVVDEDNAPEEIVELAEEPAQEAMIEVVEETIQEEIIVLEEEETAIEEAVIIEEEVVVEEQPIENVMTEHPQEKVVIEAMDVENSPAPVKDMPVENENVAAQSLTINPYPLEEEELAKVEPKEVIYWNTPEKFDVIEGFGSDMPLALALRQIVPPQYAFSFGEGVNAGMRISWQGGSPWNQVLSDALAPHGVATSVNNKKVLLRLAEVTEEETATVTEDTASEMAEEAHPEFEDDVASIDQTDVTEEVVEEVAEDVSEMAKDAEETIEEGVDAVQDAEKAPEEAMNDALKDVYGDNAPQEPVLDTEPLNMDSTDDKGASNSMVEELLEPIEMTAEEEETMPTPDMEELSQKAEKAEDGMDAVVKRVGIQDPGPVESTQPMAEDLEKKN